MRAHGLEADRAQVLGRQHAGGGLPALVAERLDRPHAPAGQVLGHALQQHPAQAAALEVGQDVPGHQQDRIRADRRGRERDGPGHVRRWRVQHVAGRHPVDVEDLAAGPPLQQGRRDPRLLLEPGVTGLARPVHRDRIELPEHACPAAHRHIVEVVERDVDGAAAHETRLGRTTGAVTDVVGARSSPATQPPRTPTSRPSAPTTAVRRHGRAGLGTHTCPG